MEEVILSEEHIKLIKEINNLTSNRAIFAGSLEDYLLLERWTEPIGDLDVIVYEKADLDLLIDRFNAGPVRDSMFNPYMEIKHKVYSLKKEGAVNLDFFVPENVYNEEKYTVSMYKGMSIKHRKFGVKVRLVEEWVTNSRNDTTKKGMKIYKKFASMLTHYDKMIN